MNEITINDLEVLSNYVFENSNQVNNNFIGVLRYQENSEWKEKLVKVSSENLNCCFFRPFFGECNLENVKVRLDDVCSYLLKYDWEQIKLRVGQDKTIPCYRAFETVCLLAMRQLMHNKTSLFTRVSDYIPGDFNFYWNPFINGKFLLSLQKIYFPNQNLELRFKDTDYLIFLEKQLTKEDLANIKVVQREDVEDTFNVEDNPNNAEDNPNNAEDKPNNTIGNLDSTTSIPSSSGYMADIEDNTFESFDSYSFVSYSTYSGG